MVKRQHFKTGEKVLFSVTIVFMVLAVIGYILLETVRMNSDKPLFDVKTRYEFNEQGERGSVLFREARCTSCHRAMRNGTNMGLSLDGLGSARDYDWIMSFLKHPEKTYNAKTIDHGDPPKEAAYVAQLPEQDLQAIASFLAGLKSDQGSSSSPLPPEGPSPFIDNMLKAWAPNEWKDTYQDIRTKEPPPGMTGQDPASGER